MHSWKHNRRNHQMEEPMMLLFAATDRYLSASARAARNPLVVTAAARGGTAAGLRCPPKQNPQRNWTAWCWCAALPGENTQPQRNATQLRCPPKTRSATGQPGALRCPAKTRSCNATHEKCPNATPFFVALAQVLRTLGCLCASKLLCWQPTRKHPSSPRSACLVSVDRAACAHERMSSLRLSVRHRLIERVLDSESDSGRR